MDAVGVRGGRTAELVKLAVQLTMVLIVVARDVDSAPDLALTLAVTNEQPDQACGVQAVRLGAAGAA